MEQKLQRWRKYFFHVPELDLNSDQRGLLRDKFEFQRKKGYMFQSESLDCYYTNTKMLEDIYPENIIEDINKICKGYEFLANYGEVLRHRDRIRFAALTIPVYNEDEVGTEFWDEAQSEVIENLHYDNKTWIMRTQVPHSVRKKTPNIRVFWQGSIHGMSFDDVMNEYEEGNIFKS